MAKLLLKVYGLDIFIYLAIAIILTYLYPVLTNVWILVGIVVYSIPKMMGR